MRLLVAVFDQISCIFLYPFTRFLFDSQSLEFDEPNPAQEKLSNLREALQSMDASTRRVSISNLPLRVRGLLVKHMEGSSLSSLDSPDRSPKKLGSSSIRLRAVTSSTKATKGATSKYSAQMDIDCLRSYTRQVPLDVAIEHQLVLSDLRDKLLGASEINPSIWCPPFEAWGHVETCLNHPSDPKSQSQF